MNFDDIKEKLLTEFANLQEKIKESSAYNQLKDKYDNLTPNIQRAVFYGSIAFIILIFLYIPYSYYDSSTGYESTFKVRRQLIRDLLKVSKEVQEAPDLPMPPSADSLKTQIDSQLQAARILPEQISGVEQVFEKSTLIADNLISYITKVSLTQLNLRQILDIGAQLESLSPSVKMKDLFIEPNQKDSRYFNVTYKLVALKIPEPIVIAAEPEEKPKKGGPPKKKPSKEDENE